MQKYSKIVKNKLNSIIRKMENNVSAFVADPKKDFIRKSELSFSKTMRFILGMGSQTLGKELMNFYGFDSKMVSVSAIVQRRSKILPSAFQHLFHEFNRAFSQTDFFTDTDCMPLTTLMYIYLLFLMIMELFIVQMINQKAIILYI